MNFIKMNDYQLHHVHVVILPCELLNVYEILLYHIFDMFHHLTLDNDYDLFQDPMSHELVPFFFVYRFQQQLVQLLSMKIFIFTNNFSINKKTCCMLSFFCFVIISPSLIHPHLQIPIAVIVVFKFVNLTLLIACPTN